MVRKQHNTGYKHKANVRNYYMQFEEAQTQELIDSKIMEHLAKAGAGPQASYCLAFGCAICWARRFSIWQLNDLRKLFRIDIVK